MEVRTEEILSSFLSFPSCVTLYRQLNSRIRPLAICNVADTLWKPWISEGGHLLERTVIECYQSNLGPQSIHLCSTNRCGPIDRSPSASSKRNSSFLDPFVSLRIYIHPYLFLHVFILIFLCVFFFPPCVLSHFIQTFLACLSPLFYLPNFVFFCISLCLTPFRPYSPPFLFLIYFLHSLLHLRLFILTLCLSFSFPPLIVTFVLPDLYQ